MVQAVLMDWVVRVLVLETSLLRASFPVDLLSEVSLLRVSLPEVLPEVVLAVSRVSLLLRQPVRWVRQGSTSGCS